MLKKDHTKPVKVKKREENGFNGQASGLTKALNENIACIKSIFDGDDTVVIHLFENKYLPDVKCCVIYVDGMVNIEILNENIIQPILSNNLMQEIAGENLLQELQYKVIASNSIQAENKIADMISKVIYGDTLFLLDGYDKALIINTKGWKTRAIVEPESEKVVRGPREGFNESIMMNISLLRRKIKSPDLKIKFRTIGERTRTKVCMVYLEELVLKDILHELEKRLDEINIDAVLDSGYIQELIRDAPFSPFETVGYTERPDIAAAKILEGRIALIVDGSPVVLTVPFIMAEGTQANEDYYNNYIFASINRLIRTTSTILAVSIPSIYLSLVAYHQEMVPTPLLLSLSASRQGVPFPTSLSLFIMLLIFDILREAGTRMPSAIGQAVNIVGALVLGQAAVEAKLVGAPVVIITALSGILTLLNINMIGATIVVRFFLLIVSSIMGIYGFIFGFMLVVLHLMSIRSFGVPYMLNLSTVKNHNGQDIWIRAPWWSMTLRPKIIASKNLVRQSAGKVRRK